MSHCMVTMDLLQRRRQVHVPASASPPRAKKPEIFSQLLLGLINGGSVACVNDMGVSIAVKVDEAESLLSSCKCRNWLEIVQNITSRHDLPPMSCHLVDVSSSDPSAGFASCKSISTQQDGVLVLAGFRHVPVVCPACSGLAHPPPTCSRFRRSSIPAVSG